MADPSFPMPCGAWCDWRDVERAMFSPNSGSGVGYRGISEMDGNYWHNFDTWPLSSSTSDSTNFLMVCEDHAIRLHDDPPDIPAWEYR